MKNYPTLKTGSTGSMVVHLKNLIASRGFPKYSGTDDAYFYKALSADVGVFQATFLGPNKRFLLEERGVVSGEVGELTWRALEGEFNQFQGTITPNLITDNSDPRSKFLNQLIAWRKAEVKEVPKGSNEGPVVSDMQRFHGMRGEPWCAMAINYCHHLTFGTLPPWGKCARVCDIMNTAISKGITIPVSTRTMCPGDIAVLIYGGLKPNGRAPSANGHIWTITGVDGSDVLGIDGNSGDRIRASRRSVSSVHGVIRLWPKSDNLKLAKWIEKYESGEESTR